MVMHEIPTGRARLELGVAAHLGNMTLDEIWKEKLAKHLVC